MFIPGFLRTLVVGYTLLCSTHAGVAEIAARASALQGSPKSEAEARLITKNLGCLALTGASWSSVFYKGSTVYTYENGEFWSVVEFLSPSCVFRPKTASQLGQAIRLLSITRTKFAVRGGGHMGIKGANNIDNGVLIVMSNLTTLSLSQHDSVLSVGPSYKWGDVYAFLEPKGLIVQGGRLAPIGVPGLLLGGGISFYGNQYGFACDSVINFEVVLADGSIVNANKRKNPDLYWALKGGSSNFGIVTRFDLQTYSSPKVWAGVYSVDPVYFPEFLAATANYTAFNTDPKSGIIPAVIATPNIAAAILFYDSPTESFPNCLKPFTNIPSISSTLDFKTLKEFALETGAVVVPDIGDVFASGTIVGKTYEELLKGVQLINSTFFEAVPKLTSQIPAANLTTVQINWEPINELYLQASAKTGGNALGLDGRRGNYICYAQVVEWTGSKYDGIVYAWVEATANAIAKAVQGAGVYDPFHYMGDSAGFQIPGFYNGYGQGNGARLKAISLKYDSKRVFQNLMPGGFKLGA